MDATTIREWLTVREFMARHKLGKNLVYESVRDSRIPSIKVGGKILIPSDALDRLLEDKDQSANTNLFAGRMKSG